MRNRSFPSKDVISVSQCFSYWTVEILRLFFLFFYVILLDYIDSFCVVTVFCFIFCFMRLCFLTHEILWTFKSCPWRPLYTAYMIRTRQSYPHPFHKVCFRFEIEKNFMNIFPFWDKTDSIFHVISIWYERSQ